MLLRASPWANSVQNIHVLKSRTRERGRSIDLRLLNRPTECSDRLRWDSVLTFYIGVW